MAFAAGCVQRVELHVLAGDDGECFVLEDDLRATFRERDKETAAEVEAKDEGSAHLPVLPPIFNLHPQLPILNSIPVFLLLKDISGFL